MFANVCTYIYKWWPQPSSFLDDKSLQVCSQVERKERSRSAIGASCSKISKRKWCIKRWYYSHCTYLFQVSGYVFVNHDSFYNTPTSVNQPTFISEMPRSAGQEPWEARRRGSLWSINIFIIIKHKNLKGACILISGVQLFFVKKNILFLSSPPAFTHSLIRTYWS